MCHEYEFNRFLLAHHSAQSGIHRRTSSTFLYRSLCCRLDLLQHHCLFLGSTEYSFALWRWSCLRRLRRFHHASCHADLKTRCSNGGDLPHLKVKTIGGLEANLSSVYVIQATILTWTTNNQSGHFKRAINAGWTIGVGNISGIIASFIYPATQGPKFIMGYSICLSLMAVCGLTQGALVWALWRENKKRERGERDYRLRDPELKNMGDDDPRFRFVY